MAGAGTGEDERAGSARQRACARLRALTATVTRLAQDAGMPVLTACRLVGLPRASFYRISRGYRHYRPVLDPLPQALRAQPAALGADETAQIVEVLGEEDYRDCSIVEAYWQAFDAGRLACSERTVYRVASDHGLVGDRRRGRHSGQPARSTRKAPAVAAGAVGDLWSWDVSELKGPRWERYYLYLAIDVFSRYPVAWRVETTESKILARQMFAEAITTHQVPKVIHSDNGAIMRAHELVTALQAAGVLTSFSRPRVSDDNPFSESLFKTVKYDLCCPATFEGLDHARTWTADFLTRYANDHHHSGLGRHTPASVFTGTAHHVQAARQARLNTYYDQHPERFRKAPKAPDLPGPTGINTHLLQPVSQTG